MSATGWFNVKDYGATGDGSTNDATDIDQAVTAAQTAGGGVVYFPAGHYLYNGTGIVNNPASNVTQHLFLLGDGRGASTLDFTACSNAQCVLLDNQNAVGSGRNDGSGVRDLTLIAPTGKAALVIADLENWIVSSVHVYGGTISLTVSESRKGTVENCVLQEFSVDGIKIIGESKASNVFKDITITGAPSSTGAGVRYDRTGTDDSGGATFLNIGVNAANVGFQFTGTSPHPAFLFLRGCVVDGDLGGDGFKLVNLVNVVLLDCWSVVQQANKAAVLIDNCDYVTLLGGSFYAGGSGNAGDLSFANSCSNVAVLGSRLTGPHRPSVWTAPSMASTCARLPSSLRHPPPMLRSSSRDVTTVPTRPRSPTSATSLPRRRSSGNGTAQATSSRRRGSWRYKLQQPLRPRLASRCPSHPTCSLRPSAPALVSSPAAPTKWW